MKFFLVISLDFNNIKLVHFISKNNLSKSIHISMNIFLHAICKRFFTLLILDVEWRIGRAHAFGARGPGFDPTPKPRMAFFGSSHFPSFRQRT